MDSKPRREPCYTNREGPTMKQKRRKFPEFLNSYVLLRNQSFMKKLFVFSSLLVILPVLSVGIISYQRSAVELEEEVRQSSLLVIDQVESHIEYYLQDFEITSLKIVNSTEVTGFIKANYAENKNNENLNKSVRTYLKDQEYSRPDISNITIITDNGKVIDTLGIRNYYPAPKIKEEYWYSSVPQNGMIMLVSRTLKIKDKEQPAISLVRRLYNPQTLKPVGMLVIDINFRRIEDILDKVTISNNGYFFILDAEGHYVYHPDYSKLGKNGDSKEISKVETENSVSEVLENETRDFVTYTYSSNLGWTFFTSVQYGDLTEGISQIGKTIFLTICIALLFAYLTGYGFATALVRPIRRLQHFMKEVEVGKLNGRVQVESKDEIGQLTAGFNNTVGKLSNLLDEVYVSKLREAESSLKQKESELKMLQSQINPHFLYNSLETIRGMALEENQENIAIMSNSLGKLLRYNLKNSSSTVSLGEEIKFSEMYLQIQKFRFEDRFEYRFDIPDWAVDLTVVKFSLQPIVENCFIHAFGQKISKLMITITVLRSSESSFTIRISDTGAGIKENVLEEITRKIQQKKMTSDGQSIGILNVNHRINYLFGSEYGITIRSNPGIGTEVDMHLPMFDSKDGDLDEKNLASGR
jgi:two-component system, sensor histidine kinase YesM